MAQRTRRQDTSLVVVAGLAGAVYFLAQLIANNPMTFAIVAIVIAAIAAELLVLRPRRTRRRLLEKSNEIIWQHAEQLAKRRAQVVRLDPYGKPLLDKWNAEIDYFINNHIRPSLTNREQSLLEVARSEIARLIAKHSENLTRSRSIFNTFSESMKPIEFEVFCAEQLRQCGWDAQLTAASGDQGVDIIAEKDGLRVVVQCKLYSGSVGNDAVQQIVAGRAYEKADCCAVVTNSRYTPAAEQLASANDVLLLHYSDLPSLDTLLRRTVSDLQQDLPGRPHSRETKLASAAASTGVNNSFDFPISSVSTKAVELEPNVSAYSLGTGTAQDLISVLPEGHSSSWLKIALGIAVAIVLAVAILVLASQDRANTRGKPINATQFTTYTNDRFGFRIEYPSNFISKHGSDNGDGIRLISPDNVASLVITGANNDGARSTKDYYEDSLRNIVGKPGYRHLGGSWFVVTWINNRDEVVYQKAFIGSGSENSFTFIFPVNQRSQYEPMVTRIEKSFRPGAIEEAR